MPITLDNIDVALIKALLEDGRLSYRRLAKVANVSTPTAEARIKKMLGLGFITKIGPMFNLEKIEQGVSAIVCLKVDSAKTNDFMSYLPSLDEVRNVFLTMGESNLIIRIACSSNEELQSILDTKICSMPGVNLVNSYVVTRTIKDEQGFNIMPHIRVQLKCDYCKGEIKGTPFKLTVGKEIRYLCCKTCLNSYREKYGTRMSRIAGVLSTDGN